ncbi:MAG TPA: glycosyltransferase [Acidimicrobiales bacterium]|nr:glycosyltransferase [Acidimicrobiales bacterium]
MRLGVFTTQALGLPSGHTTYQDTLLEGLFAQTRHQIVVLASERDPAFEVPAPHEMIRIHHPRQRFVGALNFDLFAEGAATVAARRADLGALIANAQWPMPRPPGVPRIAVMYEAAFLEPSPWGVYSAYAARQFLTVPRRNLRNAEVVVCLSEHGQHDIARAFRVARERIVVAPPALRDFAPLRRSRWQPPGDYVLSVGWFHPRKDVTLTLRAWRRAVELGLNADLVLAGTEGPPDRRYGSMGRRILDHVGASLAHRVYFTGTVPRAELGALYRNASGLIMTSMHEGFGIPAIEAFSMGVPVVAARRTSLPEVVGPAGVVVASDPDALGKALVEACTSVADRQAMRAYASTFTVERQVAPFLAIADRLEPSGSAR